ncbi:MAG: hypothetical protein RLZZ450_4289 [Pseudomonadota bacterium]|jgi:DNA-binding transcriptional LysR family regulator
MNTTPSWDDLRVLLAVHRHKSFLAAGKALGVATSTVARRIEALEREVGRSLVHRGNDGTQLDPDAAALVSLGEQLELGLLSLRRDGRESEVSGTVRVSLSEGFVRPVVRALARLRVKHPELSVELISESRLADLARREADIGIRIVRTASPAVVHKPLGSAVPALFAARDYVDRRLPGARLSRESAGLQDWVGFDSSLQRMPHERWLRAYGARRFVFQSNSAIASEQAVLAGLGIGLLNQAEGARAGGLVQLETESAPPAVPVLLAFHRAAAKTPRVRAVINELSAELRRLR